MDFRQNVAMESIVVYNFDFKRWYQMIQEQNAPALVTHQNIPLGRIIWTKIAE